MVSLSTSRHTPSTASALASADSLAASLKSCSTKTDHSTRRTWISAASKEHSVSQPTWWSRTWQSCSDSNTHHTTPHHTGGPRAQRRRTPTPNQPRAPAQQNPCCRRWCAPSWLLLRVCRPPAPAAAQPPPLPCRLQPPSQQPAWPAAPHRPGPARQAETNTAKKGVHNMFQGAAQATTIPARQCVLGFL